MSLDSESFAPYIAIAIVLCLSFYGGVPDFGDLYYLAILTSSFVLALLPIFLYQIALRARFVYFIPSAAIMFFGAYYLYASIQNGSIDLGYQEEWLRELAVLFVIMILMSVAGFSWRWYINANSSGE